MEREGKKKGRGSSRKGGDMIGEKRDDNPIEERRSYIMERAK